MWLILIVLILHFTRHGIIYPFVPLLAEAMGASLSTIGFTVGAFSLIAVFLSVPLGGLVDRFGVKRLLLFGVGCNILNAFILIRADTVSKLIIAQMIAGLAFLLLVVASQAYFSRLSDPSQREKGFGWLGFGASAGQSVGPILGGFLVDRFDYQAAFWVVLVLSSMGLALVGLKRTRESNPTKLSYNLVQDTRQARALAMDPSVLMILVLLMVLVFTFAIIFAVNLRSSFLPVFLRAEGLTEASVGLLISVFAVTSTSIRLIFGKLVQLFDRKKIIAVSMLAVALGAGLIPSMFSPVSFAVILAVFGLGFGMTQPLSMVMIADLTDPSQSGLAMGLRFTALMVASLLSPIFLGFLVGTFGLTSAFYVAAVVVTLCGIRMLIVRPELIPTRRL
jgi:MFS family permease